MAPTQEDIDAALAAFGPELQALLEALIEEGLIEEL